MVIKKELVIICPYPFDTAPSQRYRHELFLDYFYKNGVDVKIFPFLDRHTWTLLYSKHKTLDKLFGIIKGFLRRFLLLFTLRRGSIVLIHREATPLFYPWFEWFLCKIKKTKVIYEFDDAIWLVQSDLNLAVNIFRYNQKVS